MNSLRIILMLALIVGLDSPTMAQVRPIADYARKLGEIGRLIGPTGQPCSPGWAPEFGQKVWRVGDVDGNGTVDWAASIVRCDTSIKPPWSDYYRYPVELMLYKSKRGALPRFDDGIRIGPTEIASKSSLVTVGDFDGDARPDLVLWYEFIGDTSFGNTAGYEVGSLIIMWGNAQGDYSIHDTTRLACETDAWMPVISGAGDKFDGDDVDDLFIHHVAGFQNGYPKQTPRLRFFRGVRGKRWGRDPQAPRTAEWTAWTLEKFMLRGGLDHYQRMRVIDHDCDGAMDIVFHRDNITPARLSILYGRPGGFPDTLENETINPETANAKSSLITDVTGDHSPELLLTCGFDRDVKIYAGRPGQRITAQYGSGNDEPIAGGAWWRRPWATMWTPDHLDSSWGPAGFGGFLELGDVDHDGRDDIWLRSDMYLGYLTGSNLDSLADTWLEVPGTFIGSVVQMGDIDGSGRRAIAISYDIAPHEAHDPFPGGILFVYGTPSLAQTIYPQRTLPHVEGEHCEGVAGSSDHADVNRERAQLYAAVDGARSVIRLDWQGTSTSESATCSAYSVLGSLLYRSTVVPGTNTATIPLSMLGSGLIIVSIETSSSIPAVAFVYN